MSIPAPFELEVEKVIQDDGKKKEIVSAIYRLRLFWIIKLGIMFDVINGGNVTFLFRIFPLSFIVSFGVHYEL